VSDVIDPVVASHLIPRRLGSKGATSIMERFAGVTKPVGPYNPKIGLTLAYDVNH
jgi:hypothetical protein